MPLVVAAENLDRFRGGQLRIENPVERDCFFGRLKCVFVEGKTLRVELVWFARLADDGQWYALEDTSYAINLGCLSTVQDLGRGAIRYWIRGIGECGTFFPVDWRCASLIRAKSSVSSPLGAEGSGNVVG